jgi:hypothetical protein
MRTRRRLLTTRPREVRETTGAKAGCALLDVWVLSQLCCCSGCKKYWYIGLQGQLCIVHVAHGQKYTNKLSGAQ